MSIRQGNNTIAGSGYTKSEVDTLLTGKANTDMSNLSRVETQIINNFGMPDYTAGGSRSANISYTESENGYLVVTPSLQSGNSELNIEIAGQNFRFCQGFDGVDYNHLNIGVFPIPRNVTYRITRWQNVNVKFFPCIGG